MVLADAEEVDADLRRRARPRSTTLRITCGQRSGVPSGSSVTNRLSAFPHGYRGDVPPPVPSTEMVRPGLWSIGVPFPDNPLGYTLVYLIESDRGPVLVDAGWDDDESWDALVAGFRAAGADIAECYGVLVTHVHPDHHGLSGRVRDASDAWVAMHERDAVTVEHLSLVDGPRRGPARCRRCRTSPTSCTPC